MFDNRKLLCFNLLKSFQVASLFSILESPFSSSVHVISSPTSSLQVDGKVVDGLLGDANGVEPPPGRVKNSVKWQKPRFSRKALMKCCLVKWIIASTQPQDKGERRASAELNGFLWPVACRAALALIAGTLVCICVTFCGRLTCCHRVESPQSFYSRSSFVINIFYLVMKGCFSRSAAGLLPLFLLHAHTHMHTTHTPRSDFVSLRRPVVQMWRCTPVLWPQAEDTVCDSLVCVI